MEAVRVNYWSFKLNKTLFQCTITAYVKCVRERRLWLNCKHYWLGCCLLLSDLVSHALNIHIFTSFLVLVSHDDTLCFFLVFFCYLLLFIYFLHLNLSNSSPGMWTQQFSAWQVWRLVSLVLSATTFNTYKPLTFFTEMDFYWSVEKNKKSKHCYFWKEEIVLACQTDFLSQCKAVNLVESRNVILFTIVL